MLGIPVRNITSLVYYPEIIVDSSKLIVSISSLAMKAMHLFKGAYCFCMGTYEVFYKGLVQRCWTPAREWCSDLIEKVEKVFFFVLKKMFCYPVLHGGCLIATGVSSFLQFFHRCHVIQLGLALPFVVMFGEISLLFAYALMFVHNLRICVRISKLPPLTGEDAVTADRVLKSALLSIASSLSYILGISIALIGGPASVVLVFLIIGMVFGGLRVLLDRVLPYSEKRLNKLI